MAVGAGASVPQDNGINLLLGVPYLVGQVGGLGENGDWEVVFPGNGCDLEGPGVDARLLAFLDIVQKGTGGGGAPVVASVPALLVQRQMLYEVGRDFEAHDRRLRERAGRVSRGSMDGLVEAIALRRNLLASEARRNGVFLDGSSLRRAVAARPAPLGVVLRLCGAFVLGPIGVGSRGRGVRGGRCRRPLKLQPRLVPARLVGKEMRRTDGAGGVRLRPRGRDHGPESALLPVGALDGDGTEVVARLGRRPKDPEGGPSPGLPAEDSDVLEAGVREEVLDHGFRVLAVDFSLPHSVSPRLRIEVGLPDTDLAQAPGKAHGSRLRKDQAALKDIRCRLPVCGRDPRNADRRQATVPPSDRLDEDAGHARDAKSTLARVFGGADQAHDCLVAPTLLGRPAPRIDDREAYIGPPGERAKGSKRRFPKGGEELLLRELLVDNEPEHGRLRGGGLLDGAGLRHHPLQVARGERAAHTP
mmetsp:Transcript_73494/g.212696  ORF Transcript_73494/g.212696 Transcript_73494/m.212696 type:complete len:473 (-) Transcript_73494:115-1533(-)